MESELSSPLNVPLCRLIYRSDTSWDLLSNEMLLQLCTSSAKANQEKDITGLLLLSGESFLQVLEGPADQVNPLYLKIAADKRHENVTLLTYEQISKRYFDDWAMHVVDLHELSLEQRDYLQKKYSVEEGSIRVPDDDRTAFSLLLDARVISLAEDKRAASDAD